MKNIILEQAGDNFDEKTKKAFLKLIELQKANRATNSSVFDMLADPGRVGQELMDFKEKYMAIAVVMSVVNVAIYKFYLKPGGALTRNGFIKFCEWAQKNFKPLQKLPLINVKGLVLGRDGWGKLQKEIKQVADAAKEGTVNSLMRKVYNTVDDIPGAKPGFSSYVKGGFVAGKIAGFIWWKIRGGDDKQRYEWGRQQEILKKQERGEELEEERQSITTFWAQYFIEAAELIIMFEWIMYEVFISPFLETNENPSEQPYALLVTMLVSGGVANLLFNGLIRFLSSTKRIITARQVEEIFDKSIINALENAKETKRGASGLDNFVDDFKTALDDSVDEVFNNLNANAKILGVPMGSQKEVNVIMSQAKLGEVGEGAFDLQNRIKGALKETIENDVDPQVVFNKLIDDVTEHLTNNVKQDDLSKAMQIADRIIQSCYQGAGNGIDTAMSKLARKNERIVRRIGPDATDQMRMYSGFYSRGLSTALGRQNKQLGDLLVDDDFTTAILKQSAKYDQITRELIADLRAVDEDFQTYFYLAQVDTIGGLKRIPEGPLRPGKGARSAGNDAAESGFYGIQDQSGNVVTTHWRNNKKAKEEIIRKFNEKVEALNDELKQRGDFDDFLKSKNAIPDNVVKLRPDDPIDAAQEMKLFETFKDSEEVEELIKDVFDDSYKSAMESYERVQKELFEQGQKNPLGRRAYDELDLSDELQLAVIKKESDIQEIISEIEQIDVEFFTRSRLGRRFRAEERLNLMNRSSDLKVQLEKAQVEVKELRALSEAYGINKAEMSTGPYADEFSDEFFNRNLSDTADEIDAVPHEAVLGRLNSEEELLARVDEIAENSSDVITKREQMKQIVRDKLLIKGPNLLKGFADDASDAVRISSDSRTGVQKTVDWVAELSAAEKFGLLAGLGAVAYVTVNAFDKLLQKDKVDEDVPLEKMENIMNHVSFHDNFMVYFLTLLSYNAKTGNFMKEGDRKLSKVATDNFINMAKASGILTGKRRNNKGTIVSNLISRIKEEAGEETLTSENVVGKLKERVVSDDFASRLRRSSFFSRVFQEMIDQQDPQKNPNANKRLAKKVLKNINDFAVSCAIAIIVEVFHGNENLDSYLKNEEPEPGDLEYLVYTSGNMKGQIQKKLRKRYRNHSLEGIQRQLDERLSIGKTHGDYKFLSNFVRETIKEYRALDNYNQYPYHSEIGLSDEEKKDFMEDWKDFELSLVRDETRQSAIELAKVLIKDLELFGDVVDLVGKNQSVATEILKNIRKKQEKQ